MLVPPIPDDELQRLKALYERGLLDTPDEERFDRLTRMARHMFGTRIALVSLVDAQRQWFKSRQGLDASETGRDVSFCGHAILGKDIFQIPDAHLDDRFADNPLVTGPPHVRFYAGAPLTTADGYTIGTLCLIDDQPRELTEPQRHALRDLADCVEQEIDKLAAQQQRLALEKAQQLNKVITRAQSIFIHQADRNAAFDGLLTDILALTDSAYGFIGEVLSRPDGQPYLKTYAITNIAWNATTRAFYEANAPQGMEFMNLDTLFGAALKSGEPVIANDPYHDPRRGGLPDGHPRLDAFLGVPIHHGGDMVAMLGIANRPSGYDQSLVDELQPLLITLGQLVDAARIRQQHRADQLELARLSRVASQTTNGVIITDVGGRVQWVNDGFTRVTGYTLAEMVGRKPGEILQGDESDPGVIAVMHDALQRAEPFDVDVVNYTKAGEPYWINISCNPFKDSNGNLQGFMAIESDISERKAADEQLRSTTQLLNSIVENVPNMIFLKHASDLRYKFLNNAGERLLGRERDQLLGRTDHDFLPEEVADEIMRLEQTVLEQDGVVDIPEESIDTPLGPRVLHTQMLALRDNEGDAQYLLGIAEDITERKRVERMKSEFVSTVSHELRTPLTSISGSLGLLAGGVLGSLPDQVREMVTVAHKNSQRLSHLIDDLLDMEKLIAGKMSLEMMPQKLMPLLEQSVVDIRGYADQYDVSVSLSGCDASVCVDVDAQRLQQVLANLLSNAAKFSPEGGVVEMTAICRGDAVRVEVRDSGPGIPAEFQSRLFEKFSQADATDTRRRGGTGLGLAISRELIERMAGSIGFSSREGQGACFHFELPIKSSLAADLDSQ